MDNNQQQEPDIIAQDQCPFGGLVYLFKDEIGFWAEHQRDGREPIITDYLPLDDASAAYESFINNTQF